MTCRGLLAAGIVLAGIIGPGAIRAARCDDVFLDDSVGRVNRNEVLVGLWEIDYGLPGRLRDVQVSTTTVPYLAFIADGVSANVDVKYEPWRRGAWRTAVDAGLTYLRFSNDPATVNAFIIPISGRVGYYRGRWGLVAGVTANVASTTATVDSFHGALLGTNVQLPIGVELRAASWLHLALRRTTIVYQSLAADGSATIDPQTMAEAYVVHRMGDPLHDAYTTFDAVFGGHRFGLRLGVGWGKVELPFVHLIVPADIVLPRGDLYVRF